MLFLLFLVSSITLSYPLAKRYKDKEQTIIYQPKNIYNPKKLKDKTKTVQIPYLYQNHNGTTETKYYTLKISYKTEAEYQEHYQELKLLADKTFKTPLTHIIY
jgi:hypothetical protein